MEIGVEVSLVSGKDDAETGEGNIGGNEGIDLAECLAVGDDEAGPNGDVAEEGSELVRLEGNGDAMVVEEVSGDLHLGENHAACGGFGVDGGNEHDEIAGREKIPK